MNGKRVYYILITALCLTVAGFVVGAYGLTTILQQQAQPVIDSRSKSASLELQQTQLNTAKASIIKYKEVGEIAKTIVPQDKDQAQAVREIVNIAAANGVQLGNITFPSSTLGLATGAKLSQLKAAPGISGVYTMQLTVQSDTARPTSYNKYVEFLSALERNRRTALVSGMTVQPDTKDPSLVSFTLTIDEYIKP
jgi:hypothetical protein